MTKWENSNILRFQILICLEFQCSWNRRVNVLKLSRSLIKKTDSSIFCSNIEKLDLDLLFFPNYPHHISVEQILSWTIDSTIEFFTTKTNLTMLVLNISSSSKKSYPQGCARFAVFLQKYFEFQILWSLSSVDFFLSQSKSQFQLDFNLHFVVVLDTLPSQWCRNIFLKIHF